MELKIINNTGKENGTVQFDETLVFSKASPALLHEIVVAYRAAQRSGTHSTKTRTEVSGGGIKPWRQKGTGRARSGSTRSPLWRHGGIIFGPKPRDYSQNLPVQKKRAAFRMAINNLIQENRLQVVDPITLSEPKTKHVAAIFQKWEAPTDSLFVVDKIDPTLRRAARNIAHVKIRDAESLNTYECLGARRLFVTASALSQLSTRLSDKKEEEKAS